MGNLNQPPSQDPRQRRSELHAGYIKFRSIENPTPEDIAEIEEFRRRLLNAAWKGGRRDKGSDFEMKAIKLHTKVGVANRTNRILNLPPEERQEYERVFNLQFQKLPETHRGGYTDDDIGVLIAQIPNDQLLQIDMIGGPRLWRVQPDGTFMFTQENGVEYTNQNSVKYKNQLQNQNDGVYRFPLLTEAQYRDFFESALAMGIQLKHNEVILEFREDGLIVGDFEDGAMGQVKEKKYSDYPDNQTWNLHTHRLVEIKPKPQQEE